MTLTDFAGTNMIPFRKLQLKYRSKQVGGNFYYKA